MLLNVSEQGYYSDVMSIFYAPMKQCPELLFLGIISSTPVWHVVQQEIISQLLPLFINSHPTYSSVFQYAWRGQNVAPHVQSMLMQAMTEWYLQNDTPDYTRMSRILDVAQDLKVLSTMLNVNQFPFVIDLACWASRREFLKLDKWISDKIKEHQEPFIAECIQFLVSRAPKPLVQGVDRNELLHETITTILACLQQFLSVLKPELAEKLRMLIKIHGPITPKPRPLPSLSAAPGIGLQPGAAPTLEMPVLGLGGLPTPSFSSSGLGGLAPGSPGKNTLSTTSFTGLPSTASQLTGQVHESDSN